MIKRLRKLYFMIRDTDWEYIIPYLFCSLKYRNFNQRIKALRHVKQAFFERRFSHILKKYKSENTSGKKNSGPIWVCWLQGEEHMPPVVKRCYERLKLMAPKGREVVLVHFGNIDQYVQLPGYIYEKLKKGYMTYTHFSDILRFALLAEKGGVWVDSTVFATSPIPEDIFSKPYYSIRQVYDPEYLGINRCLWKCFLVGAAAKSQWFLTARDIMYAYWKQMDYFIDYLIVDYILILVYDSNHEVRSALESGVEFAPHILGFEKIANDSYDEVYYQKMCRECRWFKLSFKLPFREYTDDGRMTYFGRLMSEQKS